MHIRSFLGSTAALGVVIGLSSSGVVACSGGDGDGTGGAGAATSTGGVPGAGGLMTGGTPGSGAAPATGGAPGTGATGGGGTAGGAGVGCAGADIFCEDFEAVADGEIPTGNGWLPDGMSCAFQTGQFSKGVATDQPRGGSTKAMKFTNKHQADCRLTANFGSHEEFWIRSYVYWSPSVDFTDRETIPLDLNPTGKETDDSTAVRFGSRTKQPCTEANGGSQVTAIGWGSEYTGCDGSKPVIQGSWYCLEAHVRQSGGSLELNSYINGEALTYGQNSIAPEDTVLVSSFTPAVDQVRIGPFSTGAMQGDLWIDDVAVATSRVGCAD